MRMLKLPVIDWPARLGFLVVIAFTLAFDWEPTAVGIGIFTANTLVSAIPTITGLVVAALKPYVPALNRWNTAYNTGQGTEQKIPKPDETMNTRTVQPGVTAKASPDVEPTHTSLAPSADQWIETTFRLTDFERTQVVSNYQMAQLDAAVRELLRDLEKRLLRVAVAGAARAVSRFDGSVDANNGTRPTLFAKEKDTQNPLPLVPVTNAAEYLTAAEAPMDGRCIILDEVTYHSLAAIPDFSRVNWTGQTDVERSGMIGRKLNFDWFLTGGAQKLAAEGTESSLLINAGNLGAGSTALTVDGGSANATILKGEVVGFSTTPRSYRLAADGSVTATKVTGLTLEAPGIIEPLANDDPLTVISRGRKMGLACHRDFMLINTVALPTVPGESMATRVGPFRFRVVMDRQSDQTAWKIQCAYAAAVHRPKFGVAIVL